MSVDNATEGELYPLLPDVQDRLTDLAADDRLAPERDAEQTYGPARRPVNEAVEHLDAARQILAALETRDHELKSFP
ncbi:hypothetical protein [Arthrobacter sp. 135MFCol5.1]|uniref:hypothetical protein n=1 Tax=Arthrobacter sp. 135MFCol5.1 TaxID=1158050 RepID=UPI00036F7F27|nr:hypothetical protein [Arthrobacter sp. 135MFCol5.1]